MANQLVMAAATPARVAVIGAGLAGSLLSLALARRGQAVTLFGPDPEGDTTAATPLSYGALLGRQAAGQWRQLERLHGPLGWNACGGVLHGFDGPLDRLPPGLLALGAAVLPVSRVDPSLLVAALPTVLERAGVERRRDAVSCLDTLRPEFSQVVLAAGASCRLLWPALPPRLRYSWAGVLTVPHNPGGSAWLELVRRGKVVLPRHWQRPGLEAKAAELEQQAWVVDTGLAPWGKQGVVLGQISLIQPREASRFPGPPPEAAPLETELRRALGRLDPALATLEGSFQLRAVTFCTEGDALVGPVERAEGLWIFTGFRTAFGGIPPQAERLAEAIQQSVQGGQSVQGRQFPPRMGGSRS